MSAELLRRAAASMRERATDADSVRGPGAWKADGLTWCDATATSYYVESPGGEVSHGSCEEEAIHIASWHPAVALAVADLLEQIAGRYEYWDYAEEEFQLLPAYIAQGIALARAYLGASA